MPNSQSDREASKIRSQSVPKGVPMTLPFTKMQGLGNDFIVIVEKAEGSSFFPSTLESTSFLLTPDHARKLCDRRFGIGADQILWLRKPQGKEGSAQIRMEILNSDGSVAEMCGNGIRAVALFLRDYASEKRESYQVETLAGLMSVSVEDGQVLVNMGAPQLGKGTISGEGERLDLSASKLPQGYEWLGAFYEVGMGNPHAIFFMDSPGAPSLDELKLEEIGPIIEKHSRFPKRTNVEFVRVIPDAPDGPTIQVRVWERGAGITLACGTGACASAVATLATGRANGPLHVDLPGGRLKISWAGKADQPVMMRGPAREVFSGRYSITD